MGFSSEFQRHTAPTIAATWTYCKVCVVDILGHIYVKSFNIMEQGLEEILLSLVCAPAPQPLLANIDKTSTCHTAKRKEVVIMFVLAEGGNIGQQKRIIFEILFHIKPCIVNFADDHDF